MWGKYFSGREEKNFYLPGQEIKIDKSFSFNNYTCEKDPLSTCKNRVAFATLMFLLVYAVIGVRLFNVCITPNNTETQTAEEADTIRAYAANPIKRADILDRNGTIIATSLPTVNLYANPKKILNAKKAAAKAKRYMRPYQRRKGTPGMISGLIHDG